MLKTIILTAIATLLLSHLFTVGGVGFDDTDSHDGQRSGLSLYTDHGTGVQYVGALFGSITVRVDANGDPVVVKPE